LTVRGELFSEKLGLLAPLLGCKLVCIELGRRLLQELGRLLLQELGRLLLAELGRRLLTTEELQRLRRPVEADFGEKSSKLFFKLPRPSVAELLDISS
jgi:hypothetical protein